MQAEALKAEGEELAAQEAAARQNYQQLQQTVSSLQQSAKVAIQKTSTSAAQVKTGAVAEACSSAKTLVHCIIPRRYDQR
jgi:hypothetical protein